ncbi:MAG: DUF72 domain-containing protein [Sphingomonas sp.]|uniref:DUF72 domain-containing protein n=1 Tax=Sphingomonas sp. TaxID=28214 RepID=UPI001B02F3AA|nr:DUF72 domain-containing protein [Sphingomonas sp.]MBO9622835.1 DUF72 domain-containing protein [Sphingomonas sp.]
MARQLPHHGRLRIGTAGWSIPRAVAGDFAGEGSSLERFAGRFDAAEINSSFHRPHRPTTYARWAASVPEDFRFSVKLPKTITHKARLVGCEAELEVFAEQIAGLGSKRGPLLVQLPPSLSWSAEVAEPFFEAVTRTLGGPVALEARHPSWFAPDAEALLASFHIAGVAADPAPVPQAAAPRGTPALAYFRLHGAPRVYWSSYDAAQIAGLAERASAAAQDGAEVWVIFDNTASGAAAANALELDALLRGDRAVAM